MEKACAGDRLARDLRDDHERMVLARGAVLTAALLQRLQDAGVRELVLEPRPEERLEVQARRQAAFEHRFKEHAACPFMTAIRRSIEEFNARTADEA